MKRLIAGLISHALVLLVGVALGIYLLPILTAPAAPTIAELGAAADAAVFRGTFKRELKDSDALHWGEGRLDVGRRAITLTGRIAPGPDYRLYLSPEFVETEADFERLRPRMAQVGPVKTFEHFIVPVPPSIDVAQYTTAIVWCESFGQFITAAQYREP
ncbi:MAG TPA: DM13 domain-containing protein [Methylibium sp.]|uniref:DM13 domain-containing protein n=1 Tax=Methylibium sp. TaxID=2067992 RepID=UPI002DBF56BE|nr:DM13 domain-containing protein [Methylibium sp.]HEU4460762.1 DM13 domain-containing protein [Methylibium sp.]